MKNGFKNVFYLAKVATGLQTAKHLKNRTKQDKSTKYRKIQDNFGFFSKYRKYRKYRTSGNPAVYSFFFLLIKTPLVTVRWKKVAVIAIK